MKNLVFILLCMGNFVHAQLTVQQIMQDQKWIGTSPTNVVWAWNGKTVFFNWNPEQTVGDSAYAYTLNTKQPVKANFNNAAVVNAASSGSYNTSYTQLVYAYQGDIFLLDIK